MRQFSKSAGANTHRDTADLLMVTADLRQICHQYCAPTPRRRCGSGIRGRNHAGHMTVANGSDNDGSARETAYVTVTRTLRGMPT